MAYVFEDEVQAAPQKATGRFIFEDETPSPAMAEEPERIPAVEFFTRRLAKAPVNLLGGAAEIGTQAITGAAGIPLTVMGGLGALGRLATTGSLKEAAKTAESFKRLAGQLQYEPKYTEFGKQTGQAISNILGAPAKAGQYLGEKAQAGLQPIVGVEPAAAIGATVASIGEAAPYAIGLKKGKAMAEMPKEIPVLEKALQSTVKEGWDKAVRPYVGKKTTYGRMEKYDESAANVVKDIVSNKDLLEFERKGEIVKGQAPRTLEELSQTAESNMDRIVSAYSEIAKKAGDQEVRINPAKNTTELDRIMSDRNVRVANPELINQTQALKERLAEYGDATPLDIQGLIKNLNQEAKKFYNDPAAQTKAMVYETAARQLRETLADAIGKEGKQYQALRKQYGDYFAVERDINRRWQVDARKSRFGFFDLANLGTAAELAKAVMKVDPTAAGSAAAIALAKSRMKTLNSPNYQLAKMFDKTEKIMGIMERRKPASLSTLSSLSDKDLIEAIRRSK